MNSQLIQESLTEMFFRTKSKERLLFEFPSRFEGRNFRLLNMDIDLLRSATLQEKQGFSVSQIANLK